MVYEFFKPLPVDEQLPDLKITFDDQIRSSFKAMQAITFWKTEWGVPWLRVSKAMDYYGGYDKTKACGSIYAALDELEGKGEHDSRLASLFGSVHEKSLPLAAATLKRLESYIRVLLSNYRKYIKEGEEDARGFAETMGDLKSKMFLTAEHVCDMVMTEFKQEMMGEFELTVKSMVDQVMDYPVRLSENTAAGEKQTSWTDYLVNALMTITNYSNYGWT